MGEGKAGCGEGEGGEFEPEVRVWRMGSGDHKTGSGGAVDRMWGMRRAQPSNRKWGVEEGGCGAFAK